MTGGMKTLALRLVLIGAFAIPFAADARAQWGWTTPAAPAAPAQPGSTPPPAGVSRGENFSNKPAAQLFASDCTGAGCHKGPQGLAKDRGAGSLASFLREHYTNSRESATALAAYLVGVPGAARPDAKQQPPRAATRTDEKPAERKPPGVTPPAAVPTAATPSGEPSDAKPAAKPAPRPPRQAVAPPQTPPAAAPAPAPAPAPEPPPAAAPVPAAPAAPPEPAKPQWDIFD